MNKHFKRTLCVLLSATLLLGCSLPALAAVRVVTEEEKPDMVAFFNDTVNTIKSETPKATVIYNNYVPEGGITSGGTGNTDAVDDMAESYLIPVLEGLFNNRSSMMKALIRAQFGDPGNTVETVELHRSMLRNKSVPLYGRDIVSELTPADDYDMYADFPDEKSLPRQLAITFRDVSLEEGKTSSVGKVFSLPSGTFNPMIISGDRTSLSSRLDGAQFQSFDLKNAKVITKYDKNGVLAYYGSTIDYNFSLSFHDAMNMVSVVLGYDFYTAALNAVNVILDNLGRENITAEDILKEKQLHFVYRCTVEIRDFNFDPRLFGDIDDDGLVTSADARAALRHAVSLYPIANSDDRIYADVDFDGDITSADARFILRTAVGMEEEFSEVPEGKRIKIVKVEEDLPDPDANDENGDGTGDPGGGAGIIGIFDGLDPTIKLSDVVTAVFMYINMIQGTEGETQTYIAQFIDAIKNAVGENEENNP